MAQLAIKGHKTRGKEVIEILRSLGGINALNFACIDKDCFYYIGGSGIIHLSGIPHNCMAFTLEEFLEKFPYKIGDKVQHKGATSCGTVYEVEKMRWVNNYVEYTVKGLGYNNCYSVVTAEYLQPYKEEETMGTITIEDFKTNTKEWLIDKLHGMVISNAIKTIGDLHEELHKPQYPKTFIECCEILYPNENFQLIAPPFKGHNYKQLFAFQKLLICRDTYWKIAGEQMGLGEPWKPNWTICKTKFTIVEWAGKVVKSENNLHKCILAFPTEEMRDMFYENFKELIEMCKEIL